MFKQDFTLFKAKKKELFLAKVKISFFAPADGKKLGIRNLSLLYLWSEAISFAYMQVNKRL